MPNAVSVIFPYRKNSIWMFDDERVGLREEPFVCGAPEIIDKLVEGIPNAGLGFALYFSGAPFPDHQARLDWVREEGGGNWYRMAGTDREGWLCPALFNYFSEAPMKLYVKAEARK